MFVVARIGKNCSTFQTQQQANTMDEKYRPVMIGNCNKNYHKNVYQCSMQTACKFVVFCLCFCPVDLRGARREKKISNQSWPHPTRTIYSNRNTHVKPWFDCMKKIIAFKFLLCSLAIYALTHGPGFWVLLADRWGIETPLAVCRQNQCHTNLFSVLII